MKKTTTLLFFALALLARGTTYPIYLDYTTVYPPAVTTNQMALTAPGYFTNLPVIIVMTNSQVGDSFPLASWKLNGDILFLYTNTAAYSGGGSGGTTNFILSGVIQNWTTNNQFSSLASNIINTLAYQQAVLVITNYVPVQNGAANNLTVTNPLTVVCSTSNGFTLTSVTLTGFYADQNGTYTKNTNGDLVNSYGYIFVPLNPPPTNFSSYGIPSSVLVSGAGNAGENGNYTAAGSSPYNGATLYIYANTNNRYVFWFPLTNNIWQASIVTNDASPADYIFQSGGGGNVFFGFNYPTVVGYGSPPAPTLNFNGMGYPTNMTEQTIFSSTNILDWVLLQQNSPTNFTAVQSATNGIFSGIYAGATIGVCTGGMNQNGSASVSGKFTVPPPMKYVVYNGITNYFNTYCPFCCPPVLARELP
ncbi:MAG: hypothetical protein KGL39_19620 [Patescibacteria group bacterium]|nr:hypothetical protein [Patescibacteria group bacterium]